MIKKICVLAVLALISLDNILLAQAQSPKAKFDVLSVVGSGQFIFRSPQIAFLGGSQIKLYKFNDNYFFTPNPVADWITFNEKLALECSFREPGADVSVPLNVLFYEDTIINELSVAAGVEKAQITVIPSYGYSVFLRKKDNSQEVQTVFTSILPQVLLTGENLSGDLDLAASKILFIKSTCAKLAEFQSGQYGLGPVDKPGSQIT